MDVVLRVFKELPYGRVASWFEACRTMMDLLTEHSVGDHLEIGTLFGGSAIMSAFVKQGKVVCVDPLDGYYEKGKLDPITNLPVTRKAFEQNVAHFKVGERIELVQKSSNPWPTVLEGREFTTAFIDGDHNGTGPLSDWLNVSKQIKSGGIVMFDNCAIKYPAVQSACITASATHGWKVVGHFHKFIFVVEKL